MNTDLKKIKDRYGEQMMHLCRNLFSTLLEKEGLLFNLMESNFQFSKFLYDDIINNQMVEQFKNYIYSLVDVYTKEVVVNKSPKELLKQVGYDLYECKTEDEIQYFKKYYSSDEELCTFRGKRLEKCHVFFAVKENVDDIKRENFKNPRREDDYGISVISIQFSKGDVNTLSIKNRYNHSVNNPDATFSNNLDNIIPGLKNSFEREYGFNVNQNARGFELAGYVRANDGKFYKYNYEINNVYYCVDNIIIDNFEVIKKYEEKERYIIFDYFILDLKNKEIKLYDRKIEESFIDGFNNINNIKIIKSKDTKNKKIYINGNNIEIELDKFNRMISYSNQELENVNDYFLSNSIFLTSINLPNAKKIGSSFLDNNNCLINMDISNVEEIEDNFLLRNNSLTTIDIPNVKNIGDNFLYNNNLLISVNMPNVEKIHDKFLLKNNSLTIINMPNVKEIGDYFFHNNKILTIINMPNVEKIGSCFLDNNVSLVRVSFPNVKEIGSYFLYLNDALTSINIFNAKYIGDWFLYKNNSLTSIDIPYVEQIGDYFLVSNESLISINAFNVRKIGNEFLCLNNVLTSISMPYVKEIGNRFLSYNNSVIIINMPNAEQIGDYFFYYNRVVKFINMLKIENIDNIDNESIQDILNSKQKVKRMEVCYS